MKMDEDMEMDQRVGAVDESVGYVLKQAATALRGCLDGALRPLQLTVPQYACLELLEQRPGSSNAELARGVFVSRQAMHGVLLGLQKRGLLSRPETAIQGRALPTQLTDEGRRQLARASIVVRTVEERMLDGFTVRDRRQLLDGLSRCTASLGH